VRFVHLAVGAFDFAFCALRVIACFILPGHVSYLNMLPEPTWLSWQASRPSRAGFPLLRVTFHAARHLCIMAAVSNQEVSDPSDPVNVILARFEADELGIVQAADALEDAFRLKNLLYEMDIAPRLVGIDPTNGTGGNIQEVLLLATDIAFVGWSWKETVHALCIEVPPGDRSVEEFNRRLSQGVGLAPVEEGSIMFGSLSCGHTNYGLRAIAAGMPSTDPLLSEDGLLSVEKLGKRDAEYARAVSHGLHWKVLRACVRQHYPRALPVLQGARNVAGHLQRKVHEVQGLQHMHSMAASSQKAGNEPDWQAIKRAVLRSRPPFADSVDDMIAFLATRAGGVEGMYLKYLAAFHRQFVNPSVRASVPGTLYGALAAFEFHYLAYAFLEAAFTCPVESVKQGRCCWLSAAEVNGLTRGSRQDVMASLQQAENVLSSARTVLPRTGVKDAIHESNILMGVYVKLDINMARLVLSKQSTSKTKYDSAHEVARDFVSELRSVVPKANLKEFEDLWPDGGGSGAAAAQANGAERNSGAIELYDVNASGQVVHPLALLRQKGFEFGSAVAASSHDGLHRLMNFAETPGGVMVLVRPWSSDQAATVEVPMSEFLTNWVKGDPKTQIEYHQGWPDQRTSQLPVARDLFAKGSILAGLGFLVSYLELKVQPATKVRILGKPSKKVLAAIDCDAGTIILGPDTTGVKAVSKHSLSLGGGESDSSWVEVLFVPVNPDASFFLTPCTGLENVSPLWCVATTEDEDKANMVWGKYMVQSLMAMDFAGAQRPQLETKAASSSGGPGKASGSGGSAATITVAKKGAAKKKAAPNSVTKKQAAKKPLVEASVPDSDDEAVETMLHIPVLINRRPVAKGEELLVFKPIAKRIRAATGVAPITITQLNSKRAKNTLGR
jgi:hypothetical protein